MPTAQVKLKVPAVNTNMLLLFALIIVPVQAFWRHLCFGELGTGRVDPIMAPGTPSGHAHVLFGASSQYYPTALLVPLSLMSYRSGS